MITQKLLKQLLATFFLVANVAFPKVSILNGRIMMDENFQLPHQMVNSVME